MYVWSGGWSCVSACGLFLCYCYKLSFSFLLALLSTAPYVVEEEGGPFSLLFMRSSVCACVRVKSNGVELCIHILSFCKKVYTSIYLPIWCMYMT